MQFSCVALYSKMTIFFLNAGHQGPVMAKFCGVDKHFSYSALKDAFFTSRVVHGIRTERLILSGWISAWEMYTPKT